MLKVEPSLPLQYGLQTLLMSLPLLQGMLIGCFIAALYLLKQWISTRRQQQRLSAEVVKLTQANQALNCKIADSKGAEATLQEIEVMTEREQLLQQLAQLAMQEKAARTEAQAAQQQIANILESITDAFVALDSQWQYTYVNQKAGQIFNRRPEDLIGKKIWEEFPEGIGQPFYHAYYKAVAEQIPVQLEQQYSPCDRWFENRIYPSKEGLSIFFQDITDRKQAQESLHQQAERERLIGMITQRIRQSLNLGEVLNTTVAEVRQFLQTDRVLIYRFQPDWSGVVIAESVADGWTALEGMTIPDPDFAAVYTEIYQQGHLPTPEEVYTVALDQHYLKVLAQFQVQASLVVPLLQGEQLWGLLIAHHCSQPRQWLQLEVNLLQQLANQLAIAIQQSELYQQVQQLNANLEQQVQDRTAQLHQVLGFEAVLRRITDHVRDSLDESQILQTAVQELALALDANSCNAALYDLEAGTANICFEYAVSTPPYQGRVLEMANFHEIYDVLLQAQCLQFCTLIGNSRQNRATMLACPIFDDQGVLGDLWLRHQPSYVFKHQEIRLVQQVANQCAIALRQAQLYQAAQAQVEALEALNQLKDDFLSTVSHELRTPISNMKMSIRMLGIVMNQQGKLSAEPDKAARYLQILSDECEREISLINDLLDLQRLEAGVHPLNLDSIQLQTWLPQIVKPFCERTQAQQQILQVDVASNLPPILSDLSHLERILTELLNNACKYTPPREKIIVLAWVEAEKVQLRVSNSGVEIPADEMLRIFDKFYRIPRTDRWKQGGTGLGLTLVKKLTEHLGTTLQVESCFGQTAFTLELPIAPPES